MLFALTFGVLWLLIGGLIVKTRVENAPDHLRMPFESTLRGVGLAVGIAGLAIVVAIAPTLEIYWRARKLSR